MLTMFILCIICCKMASFSHRKDVLLVNAPNRTTGLPPNLNQQQTKDEQKYHPPPYSEIDKPVLKVQNEMKRIQFDKSLHIYRQIQPQAIWSVHEVHKHSSRKTHTSFVL